MKMKIKCICQFIAVIQTLYFLLTQLFIMNSYTKCLRYRILFSICSDSQLEVSLNARRKITRIFNNDGISQRPKNKFYNSAWSFYERAFKYALDNFPHWDEILKHVEVINLEHRKDTTIGSITYFLQR